MPARPLRTRPGHPYALGATWDGAGADFALFSEHSTAQAGGLTPAGL